MTTLAQQRRALCQHARVIRAVRRVTQAAVFADRRMLPQVRAAFFRVALFAGRVHGLSRQLRCRLIAVRTVTTTAIHLALEKRVGEGFARFTALLLMAVEADLGLR